MRTIKLNHLQITIPVFTLKYKESYLKTLPKYMHPKFSAQLLFPESILGHYLNKTKRKNMTNHNLN